MRKIMFYKYLFPVIALLEFQNVKASTTEIIDESTLNHHVYCVHDAKRRMNKALYRFIISPNFSNSQQHAIQGKDTVFYIKNILDDLCSKLYAIGLGCPRESFEVIGIKPDGIYFGLLDVKDYLPSIIKLYQYFNEIEQKVAIRWQSTNASNAKLVSEKLNEYDCAMFDSKAFCIYLQHSYPIMSKSDIDKRLEYVFLIQKGKTPNIVIFEYPIDYLLMAVALSVEFKTWQFLSRPERNKVWTDELEVKFHTDSIYEYFHRSLLKKDIWALRIKDSKILYGEIQMYGYFNKIWTD